MTTRSNSQFVVASVTEFLSVWANGGKASLNLSTSGGFTTVGFNCTLGHTGAPHSIPAFSPPPSPPTSSPPRRPRHRGPVEREKNRLRAARHQEEQAKKAASAKATSQVSSSPAAPAPSTDPVTAASSIVPLAAASSTVPVTAPTSTDSVTLTVTDPGAVISLVTADVAAANLTFKCDQCSYISNSNKGLKTHTRMKHRISQLDGLEDDSELYTNPCPLCHPAEVCHCGNCEECSELISEIGFNTHIMNVHDPPEVKKHYGVDWIHKHKHLISRTASVQDRYHIHKWDTLMVL